MKKLKTEFIIIGDGLTSLLLATRLNQLGHDFVLINPKNEFSSGDLRPYNGNGLWNQALNSKNQKSLPDYFDIVVERLKETFPISIENTGFDKTESWSVLSRTPIHREGTVEYEKEYFRIEKRPNLSGQYYLMHSENIRIITKQLNVNFDSIALIDGVVQKHHALVWNPNEMNLHLNQFCFRKFSNKMFCGVTLLNKTGKRIHFETIENENFTVEAENKVLICLSGSMLEELKPMYSQYEDVWIQGLRKKRRERHFLFFERDSKLKPVPQFYSASSKWFRIGNINYLIGNDHGIATWTAQKGPDSIDRIIDEGLRAFSTNKEDVRISNAIREFYFEWEWKGPIWKETVHDTFWATGYEGDLTSTLEIIWNSPV